MVRQPNKSVRADSSVGDGIAAVSGKTDTVGQPSPSRLPLWNLPPR